MAFLQNELSTSSSSEGMIVLSELLLFGRYPVSSCLLVEFWCVIEVKDLFLKSNERKLDTVKLPMDNVFSFLAQY